MSVNQSRAEKNEPPQYRKTGRSGSSGLQRNYSGGKGGGGGSTAPPPSLSNNRSFKNPGNAQGAQSRVSLDSNNAAAVPALARGVPNGAHSQPPSHVAAVSVKPTDVPSTQKSARGVPKAPAPNSSTVNSNTVAPSTPAKGGGGFSFQFGTLSPGIMQVPARTSSAPPNLDEQKREQARYDSLRAAPILLTQSVPKHDVPTANTATVDHSNAAVARPLSKARKDVQVSTGPPATQTQKPSLHPIPGMPMQVPYHQTHIPVQFSGPNPQLQSQSIMNSSMPMPMAVPLPMGNPSQVQQQVYVQGLQSHLIQSQGVIHQGQGINFSTQMSSQLPQLSNMGINIAPQFPQQQPGNFGGHRRTVKITHPDTHEELRLEKRTDMHADAGSSAPRSHPNMPPQSQPIQSYPPGHSMKYYSNSYNPSTVFFTGPSSHPLASSTQITPSSQAPRSYNQVTVKPAANPRGEKIAEILPTGTHVVEKIISNTSRPLGDGSSLYTKRDPEKISESLVQQSRSTLTPVPSIPTVGVSDPISAATLTTNSISSASPAIVQYPTSIASGITEGTRRDVLNRSDSNNYDDNKSSKKSHSLMQTQVSTSSYGGTIETVENTKSSPQSETAGPVQGITGELAMTGAPVHAGPDLKNDISEVQGTRDSDDTVGDDSTEISANSSMGNDKPKHEALGNIDRRDMFPDESGEDASRFVEDPELISLKPSESVDQTEDSLLELKVEQQKFEEEQPVLRKEGEAACDLSSSTSVVVDNLITQTCSLQVGSTTSNDCDNTAASDSSKSKLPVSKDASIAESGTVDQKSSPIVSAPSHSELTSEVEVADIDSTELFSPSSGVKDKPMVGTFTSKNNTSKGKKKRKEALEKADRAGTTSDLYMAYKGPEEKIENLTDVESSETTSNITSEQISTATSQDTPNESKVEPDDWEDAADISTPKLETLDDRTQVGGEDGNLLAKKYSRDFLLKFSDQCKDLPDGFEITSDIAEALIVSTGHVPREPMPSPGRNADRQMGGSRMDRRGSGMGDDEKWSKGPGPLSGQNLRVDIGYGNYGSNIVGHRPVQGGNYGVLRNPRAQSPVQYPGGILSGPMQSMGPHAVMQRTNTDSDRWQRATGFQRGLIPSPHTPLQVMHKAQKKYEVGKVSDEEQAKQRQLKGILNKLTPQNFEKLFEQVKQVNIDNSGTLTGVISQIFDKALMEPTFCEMYADFCHRLAGELPDFKEDDEKITFKRLLLNKCQEEFERGEREQEEANRAEEEGEAKQSEEQREGKRIQARRRMLGNIRLIGELFKKKMLTERIMHECIKKLLGQYQNPDEEDVESLCKLMSTIGESIDHPKAKEHMDAYFDMMAQLSNNMKLSSRVRFMLKDSIDLRKNKWQQRMKVEGPKKIDEVHRDAANERQAQANRLSRGPSMGSSFRRGQQPMDFAPRGSNILSSPNAQMGGYRGSSQMRGYGGQDARSDERNPFENRTPSVPLPQRPLGDVSITLGPQGGLARGMSSRGQPSSSNVPFADVHNSDSRRIPMGLNGYGSTLDRPTYASREEHIPRFAPDRFVSPAAHDQMNSLDKNTSYGTREVRTSDRILDGSRPNTPPTRMKELRSIGNVPSEKVFPEEQLRNKSMDAIKEFYSVKDQKEVTLCVKELNAPSFYPSLISIWVTDSFERKDMERDLLAKLIVDLSKSREVMLSQLQLIQGFESVLASLEDAVNDAPKAAEFLGRMLGKVILENVIPMSEIGKLIYEGGEEKGRLVEIGLAAEVLGSVLEIIKTEKGDPGLKDICTGSGLHLENFRPPNSNRPLRLDRFI